MTTERGRRPIGFGALLALGINGIVGVGIFFAPAEVAAQIPGTSGVIVYVATAMALLPIAFGYAALGGRFDVDGGPYVWAEAAFGPGFAFLVGWLTYVSSLFSIAAVLSGLAEHAGPIFGVTSPVGFQALSVVSALVLAGVAASGLRPSAFVWSSVTVLKLLPLVTLVVVGAAAYGTVPPAAPLSPVGGERALARAALLVVFAYQGFEIVPLLAGSVRHSEWSVPWATVGSLGLAAVLYGALHALAAHAVPELASSRAPLVDAARVYGGASVAGLVAAGANVSALGIAFGMMNTTPRYLSALARPRAFGPWIGETDTRLVPQRALWLTALGAVVLLLGSNHLSSLFVLSSLAVIAQFVATLAALAVLAWRRQAGLSRRHLWPVPFSVAGILLAIGGAQREEVAVAAGVIVLGEVLRRARR